VYVTRSALREIKDLPGHVRQRVKRAIDDLENDAHPPGGNALDLPDVETSAQVLLEAWRVRIEKWRVLYVVTEREKTIDVLSVRKRPPYDYGDLARLLAEME
jgi:mRNA interferase RelE/StbE